LIRQKFANTASSNAATAATRKKSPIIGVMPAPQKTRRQPASNREDVAAVEQLLDLGCGGSHFGHGPAKLLFAAIESLSPPTDFAGVVQVDQSAMGGNRFENISHGFALPFFIDNAIGRQAAYPA
jgi:hypothetical protein